ncbi:acyl esterase [Nemania abortiva]|nr:acyl esterase [Nemania abortiva]
MPNPVRTDLHTVDDSSFPYIFEQNATIELQSGKGLVRCNIYRPKGSGPDCKVPVIATYGPYGKDTFYGDFHAKSFEEVNPAQKSAHSAWETPDPAFWTRHGYAVVRADEIGIGQSPGRLDTMSRNTSEAFFDVIEWAAAQPWSNGKVGLLGVSYYAGSQWRVAAMKPKGLAAMVPWEGMSDYYRDRCRHGGILSNNFIDFWWNRQVVSNQYGRPCDEEIITNEKTNGVGPMRPKSAPESLEGTLSAEERAWNRQDQTVDNRRHRFRDEEYYASKEYDMGDIDVPLLSVANWGGITLHLRGNIEGFVHAGSEQKWLRTITGRHDLPFYYREEVEIQRSFLDAFLKNEDRAGWKKGHVPRVSLVLRQGDVSFNNAAVERPYPRRPEKEWPIARTIWKKYYLTPRKTLISDIDEAWISPQREKLTYEALGSLENPQLIQFSSVAFRDRTEITGNIVVHLCVSATPEPGGPTPSDIDLFVTLRHISPKGTEIFYTGTAGDPVPLTKGWLRVSLRKVDKEHPKHREYLPWRQYASTDVLPVIVGEIYEVDVEVWPTSVVVEPGGQLVLEVASGDTQGCGIFRHDDPVDRSPAKFQGRNHVCFGLSLVNYIMLPVIPLEQSTDTMRDFQSSHSRVERGLLRCPRNNTSPHSLSLQRR